MKGMKLTNLYCDGAPVSDLSPLQGMPLEALALPHTRVSDLSPLRGMPLRWLRIDQACVTDLSPLREVPLLEEINCDFQPRRDAEFLRSLTTLKTIQGKPVTEFWKEVDGK